jgi:hypothetical protein
MAGADVPILMAMSGLLADSAMAKNSAIPVTKVRTTQKATVL